MNKDTLKQFDKNFDDLDPCNEVGFCNKLTGKRYKEIKDFLKKALHQKDRETKKLQGLLKLQTKLRDEDIYDFIDYKKELIEKIVNYDEQYISEDVRKAINRMKDKLTDLIKNQ